MLCVSGIYDSNVKYKYSTATLGVTVDKNGIPAWCPFKHFHFISL